MKMKLTDKQVLIISLYLTFVALFNWFTQGSFWMGVETACIIGVIALVGIGLIETYL